MLARLRGPDDLEGLDVTDDHGSQEWAVGAPRVYWMTHETNETAMALYDKVAEKSGFLVYRKAV